jgi:UDP-N-acetylmuramyl tripeptide synthase
VARGARGVARRGPPAAAASSADDLDLDLLAEGLDDFGLEGAEDEEAAADAPGAPGSSDGEDTASAAEGEDDAEPAGPRWPTPPPRERRLAELLAEAGLPEAAAAAEARCPDLAVRNVLSLNSDWGGAASLYVAAPCERSGADGHAWAAQAAELGAVAVLAERPIPGCPLPVLVAPGLSAARALGKVAAEFYGHPGRRLRAVAFVGSRGKTTAAWLTRGLLEEGGEVVAMLGDTEAAIAEDRLTREGGLWAVPPRLDVSPLASVTFVAVAKPGSGYKKGAAVALSPAPGAPPPQIAAPPGRVVVGDKGELLGVELPEGGGVGWAPGAAVLATVAGGKDGELEARLGAHAHALHGMEAEWGWTLGAAPGAFGLPLATWLVDNAGAGAAAYLESGPGAAPGPAGAEHSHLLEVRWTGAAWAARDVGARVPGAPRGAFRPADDDAAALDVPLWRDAAGEWVSDSPVVWDAAAAGVGAAYAHAHPVAVRPGDPTLERDCSTPFHAAPYVHKYEAPPATPDALALHKALAGAADRGATAAVVELCPTLAADGRAEALGPEVLVFTNAAPEAARADPAGTAAYADRIAAMFAGLESWQTAVVNLDDPLGPRLAELAAAAGAQVLTYGAAPAAKGVADVFAERVKSSIWDTEVLAATPVGRLQIILPLVGRLNAANVLAAVSVGLARGARLVDVVAGVEAVDLVPGRCELVDEGQPFPVVIDAAATPEQLGRLIDDVKEAGARRTLLVLGCAGGTSRAHRAAMGALAHFKADVVFFANDSPGAEAPDEIVADVVGGLPEDVLGRHAGAAHPWLQDPHRTPPWFRRWAYRYQNEVGRYVIEDRFTAIRVALGMARARDVVIVAGRGAADKVEVWDGGAGGAARGGTRAAWLDDRVEVRNALGRLARLDKLGDLDRGALPWTRYTEERETMHAAQGVLGEAGSGTGQVSKRACLILIILTADPTALPAAHHPPAARSPPATRPPSVFGAIPRPPRSGSGAPRRRRRRRRRGGRGRGGARGRGGDGGGGGADVTR